jgi:hypothetical protein
MRQTFLGGLAACVVLPVLAGCGDDSGDVRSDAAPGGSSAAAVRSCIAHAGLHTKAVHRRRDDLDAPDTEITVTGRQTAALVAYYKQESRARDRFPDVQRNADHADKAAERYGRITVVWLRGRKTQEAKTIRRCIK